MARYVVTIKDVNYMDVEVEADSKNEAEDIAYEKIEQGSLVVNKDPEGSYTETISVVEV